MWNLSPLWESRGDCTEVINVCECTDGSKSTRSSKKALYFKIRIIPLGHFKRCVPAVVPVISPLVLISFWQMNSTVHSVTVGTLFCCADSWNFIRRYQTFRPFLTRHYLPFANSASALAVPLCTFCLIIKAHYNHSVLRNIFNTFASAGFTLFRFKLWLQVLGLQLSSLLSLSCFFSVLFLLMIFLSAVLSASPSFSLTLLFFLVLTPDTHR